ncbi:alpha/beta hydrolase [Dasania sp. GY-MA-18]|uniref:Alpha/beta hydrolase n=1 Tax=Dasania phycosphaerae TaxID=2950436 RepID=A0A9J6RM00_9GAMM|nr:MULTISPECIES: alpha/beta hydrolase [Dasania]MCR8922584.1 alpha/beta hydrolase [Dasania sp. GY-MA-18]MCZ0865013.1 alpha/beta hydrolase [Dasania phycosphaerae]MCZ0868740.1 alpha/beta hydrolase [Dasania phycosphaerae]
MTAPLDCIKIEPRLPAQASIIWLHGLGADGNDFAPIVPELQLPEELAIRFIFPNAPAIPVTINNGYVMPAWYDILEMNIDRKVDSQQLRASAQSIQALVQQEIANGIASDRIILAGFSQGGAVCYEAALSFGQPLAGLLALSTYFATADDIAINPIHKNLPIQIFHGSRDSVVPEQLGQKAQQHLQSLGFNSQYQSFGMDHEVCYEEIKAISNWIKSCLQN